MQAENRPLPRRAASHGTLHSSYASQARPLHKPLRSVNENSALLPSPGALESMLKTTTETGDIGIFTIKPVKTSATITATSTHHGIQGSRSHNHLPMRRSVDDFRRQDDRRRLPSCRDTTSEILSLYGSNSQSSANSVFSHLVEDQNQRSCSMTTVGSRHLSHNKSSNTLQSHYSGGPLQRPRSPFPYPTRLKRPGARPASPAITESGLVDYSRMVEIDRISLSQRTGHGPGAPTLSRPHRRLPPLDARLDMNISTPILQTRGSHYISNRQSGTDSSRTASAASETSCSLSYCEKVLSSSTRTSSLTSVINMYHRMPPPLRHVQFGSLDPPPRYYDYTEDFEFKQPFVTATIEPVAPTPTRIPSMHQSLVFREGPEDQLSVQHVETEEKGDQSDETQSHQSRFTQDLGQGDTASTANTISRATQSPIATGQGTDIDCLPSQTGRDFMDTLDRSPDIASREAGTCSYHEMRLTAASGAKTASLEKQVVFHAGRTPTIRSEQGVIVRADTHDSKSEECEQKDGTQLVSKENPSQRRSKSEPATKYRGFFPKHSDSEQGWISLPTDSCVSMSEAYRNQGPRDILSSSDSLGDHRSTELDRTIGRSIGSANFMTTETIPGNTGGEAAINKNERQVNSAQNNTATVGVKGGSVGCQGQHKLHRGDTGLKIVTRNASDDDFPQLTQECSNTPLISPKPISPARQLKVKNSIPQLMKALPPLPTSTLAASTPSSTVDEYECAEILQPFSLSRSGTPRAQNHRGLQQPRDKFILRHPGEATNTQKKLPKIRFKTKVPATHEMDQRNSRPWNSESNYPWCRATNDVELLNENDDAGSHYSDRGSLRAPTYLSTYRTTSSPFTGTVRRYPDVQRSGVIQSLTNERPRDLFTASSRLCDAFRSTSRGDTQADSHARIGLDSQYSPGIAGEATPEAGPTFVAAHSSDSRRLSKAQSRISESGRTRETVSSQDARKERTRGLRKRLSNLRKLLARNRRPQSEPLGMLLEGNQTSDVDQHAFMQANPSLGNVDFESRSFTVSEGIPGEITGRRNFRRRVRDRISKWVKVTRRKMGAQSRGHPSDEEAK
ncbi:hypothetical protein PG985_006917 [Apiospora marii]|uniref:uncharacterized protein n=1 Tax=Apiospora marii TaxID=335849 RepID=UPI00312CDDC1